MRIPEVRRRRFLFLFSPFFAREARKGRSFGLVVSGSFDPNSKAEWGSSPKVQVTPSQAKPNQTTGRKASPGFRPARLYSHEQRIQPVCSPEARRHRGGGSRRTRTSRERRERFGAKSWKRCLGSNFNDNVGM